MFYLSELLRTSIEFLVVRRRYDATYAGVDNAEDNLLHEETRGRDSQGDEEQEPQSYRGGIRRTSRHNFILQSVEQLQ